MNRSLIYYLLGFGFYSPTPIAYYVYFQKAILNPSDISNQTWFDFHELSLGVLILVSMVFFLAGFQELDTRKSYKVLLTWTLFASMVVGIPNISYSPAQNPGFLALYAKEFLMLSLLGLILNGLLYILISNDSKKQLIMY